MKDNMNLLITLFIILLDNSSIQIDKLCGSKSDNVHNVSYSSLVHLKFSNLPN